jgi:hypothetical protein
MATEFHQPFTSAVAKMEVETAGTAALEAPRRRWGGGRRASAHSASRPEAKRKTAEHSAMPAHQSTGHISPAYGHMSLHLAHEWTCSSSCSSAIALL